MIRVFLIWATHNDQINTALELVRQVHPELFESTLRINEANILQAIDTAHLFQMKGQYEMAENLLRGVISTYDASLIGH